MLLFSDSLSGALNTNATFNLCSFLLIVTEESISELLTALDNQNLAVQRIFVLRKVFYISSCKNSTYSF